MSDSADAVPGARQLQTLLLNRRRRVCRWARCCANGAGSAASGSGGRQPTSSCCASCACERKGWLDGQEFEDAIAVCNLLPGPASTQLAIFCAWRLRGRLGALIGGAAFIIPGLIVILALSALFLAKSPPLWVLGAGAGAAPRFLPWPSTRARP